MGFLLAMEWSFPLSKSEMIYCSQQCGVNTTLLDVDKDEVLAADVIEFI